MLRAAYGSAFEGSQASLSSLKPVWGRLEGLFQGPWGS